MKSGGTILEILHKHNRILHLLCSQFNDSVSVAEVKHITSNATAV